MVKGQFVEKILEFFVFGMRVARRRFGIEYASGMNVAIIHARDFNGSRACMLKPKIPLKSILYVYFQKIVIGILHAIIY